MCVGVIVWWLRASTFYIALVLTILSRVVSMVEMLSSAALISRAILHSRSFQHFSIESVTSCIFTSIPFSKLFNFPRNSCAPNQHSTAHNLNTTT